jgi:vitamin B12 transporter
MSLSSCAAGFFCYYNLGQASMRGITLSGSHQFTHFEAYGSMDFLDATDDITGKQLSLRARKTVNAGMRREEGSWQWGMDLRSVGERFDDAANTRLLDGYRLINLYASKTLSRTWKLQLRVDNATNETYQEVGSFATPGRTVFATLKWQGAN